MERTKTLVAIDVELNEWVDRYSEQTGKGKSFLIEAAIRQWQQRIERGRKRARSRERAEVGRSEGR